MSTAQADLLAARVDQLWAALRRQEPGALAARTGTHYTPSGSHGGAFHFPMWGETVALAFPSFAARWQRLGTEVDRFSQALLAYYFHTADGTPPAGRWIAFTELPDGTFYTQAFQGYTGQELARHFGNNLAAFGAAARRTGGSPLDLGDAAFTFQALPRVALAAVAWLGDEDFPPSYRILFDGAIRHYLTTDAAAVLGSALTKRLLKKGNPHEDSH